MSLSHLESVTINLILFGNISQYVNSKAAKRDRSISVTASALRSNLLYCEISIVHETAIGLRSSLRFFDLPFEISTQSVT